MKKLNSEIYICSNMQPEAFHVKRHDAVITLKQKTAPSHFLSTRERKAAGRTNNRLWLLARAHICWGI